MNTLLIEPFSGMAGDMFLAALCDLCDAWDELAMLPGKLHLPDGKIEVREVSKNGIVCRQVDVIDLGKPSTGGPSHHHAEGEHHHGAHRHLRDILHLIDHANLPEGAKEIARDIFRLIGQAESEVHKIPIEKIHFHEISAVDSIIDIVGCAWLLDRLEISETLCRPICVGSGMVSTEHGLLPVPAPATAKLLYGYPTYTGEEKGERVTPTGAAILRYLKPQFIDKPLIVEKQGYGPGKKEFRAANVLRLALATPADKRTGESSVWAIESNLDDCTPESLGHHFQDQLIDAGVLDFTITPVLMKKGRPGFVLSVLAPGDKRDRVLDFILEHTPTIGARFFPVERKILPRRNLCVETPFGEVSVKEVTTPSGKTRRKAEAESVALRASETGALPSEIRKAAE